MALLLTSSTAVSIEKFAGDDVYGMYDQRMAGKVPEYGGTYRTHLFPPPRSFDPHTEISAGASLICNLAYNGLVRLAPRINEIELDAAESWRQIDALTYEFTLRKGIFYHNIPPVNAREMTSTDVKYSIERLMGRYGKLSEFRHSYYFRDKLDSIQTPDRYTVIFKTKKPYAPFIRYLASPWAKIVPKEAVDEFNSLKRTVVGSGPFMLKEQKAGSHLLFVKNPHYFKEGLPYLDGVQLYITPNKTISLTGFMEGQMDGISIHRVQLDGIRESAPNALVVELPGLYTWTLRTTPGVKESQELNAPLGDKRVRQAIAHAIDKKSFLEMAGFDEVRLERGAIPAAYPPWGLTDADLWEYNPQKGKKLLAEAGYPDGFACQLMTWDTEYLTVPMAELQQMLAEIGIRAKLNVLDAAQYFNKSYRFQYDLALNIMPAGIDPSDWLVPYFGKSANFYKWNNPQLWDLIEQQEQLMDQSERLELISQIQKIVVDEAMSQSLFSQARYLAYQPYVYAKPYFHPYSLGTGFEVLWMDKYWKTSPIIVD
jgi:peptide/nickel transport system substrate-binding protein